MLSINYKPAEKQSFSWKRMMERFKQDNSKVGFLSTRWQAPVPVFLGFACPHLPGLVTTCVRALVCVGFRCECRMRRRRGTGPCFSRWISPRTRFSATPLTPRSTSRRWCGLCAARMTSWCPMGCPAARLLQQVQMVQRVQMVQLPPLRPVFHRESLVEMGCHLQASCFPRHLGCCALPLG
jgi:hypothetical protein